MGCKPYFFRVHLVVVCQTITGYQKLDAFVMFRGHLQSNQLIFRSCIAELL